jgi:outer membrane receptor protein involved in Fe transport
VVERTSFSATTDNDGRYRIAEVAPGVYTVRARYIGYAPGTESITVTADQETTADFALAKSAQQLDEVVTTGTIIPTEARALPTPITVITANDIAAQRPRTVAELFRQVVPGAVSWDLADTPMQTTFSVRGASSLTIGAVQMKVFVDGVEASSQIQAVVDPSSIERIEVIRGPQAAAIYGSEAVGGVIQVFTKRGDPANPQPRVDLDAALGIAQTPYAGFNGVLRQSYTASVRGGSPEMSYNFGGGYSHLADWLPGGEQSAQSNPTFHGGMHFARGVLTADLSGRYFIQNSPTVFNPELVQTGFFLWAKPNFQPAKYVNQTIGARIGLAATNWWQHTLTVGVDRTSSDGAQTRPRLITPDDTLLSVFNQQATKPSIGYSTAVQGALSPTLSGSVTAGFAHWHYESVFFSASGASTTTGIVQTAPGGLFAGRTLTDNTGYFVQGQLGVQDRLFLIAGVRAEQNSDFGDSLGTPLLPRFGGSYVQQVGRATLKFRGSWGRAIRPPGSGSKAGFVSPTSVHLANFVLAPERQQGWDAGIDAFFGRRATLSVSYYDQTADNLIAQVILPSDTVFTFQDQNVGRVKNRGLEVEGTLSIGLAQLSGQYAHTHSRVETLAPGYSGELVVGEAPEFVPTHTAGASLTLTPSRGTMLATGLTYVGSFSSPDLIAYFSCLGGTGPCLTDGTFALGHEYLVTFPGFVRWNATVWQRIAEPASVFVSVDNLTNNTSRQYLNNRAVMGRITSIGLHFQY